ncbi:MAG: toll/interleukin-1 receptor domain-containing protein [Desulfuromonadaceae bacterium]|nr:toll/interleukin-1 receptor domain-containing protein [Desulfuromonadaceae bacterium]
MVPPKVFISYSHDSASHKQWVLEFATTLRSRGVYAILDQWDLKPGDDLPHFMEQNLESADYAVMVCTNRYVSKANAGEGGVGYEKMIMTSSSLTKISDNKVIPIVRENSDPKVPTFLKTKLYIDFTRDEDIEYSLDELLRRLLNAPLYEKPEIGKNPFRPLAEARPDRTSDGVRQVITDVANAYDKIKSEKIHYNNVLQYSSMPRLKFDKYFVEAVNQGLLKKDIISYVEFTTKGLEYAEEHGLAG